MYNIKSPGWYWTDGLKVSQFNFPTLQVEDNISENLKQITENCANVNERIDKIAGKGAPKKTKK